MTAPAFGPVPMVEPATAISLTLHQAEAVLPREQAEKIRGLAQTRCAAAAANTDTIDPTVAEIIRGDLEDIYRDGYRGGWLWGVICGVASTLLCVGAMTAAWAIADHALVIGG